MLDLLIKSAVRRKILALFALNSGCEIYSRQIAREIDESPHAVGLELKSLSGGGLLIRTERGRQIYYRLNMKYPFADMLISIIQKMRSSGAAEIKKIPDMSRRSRLNDTLKKVVGDIERHYSPIKIILFGSLAEGSIGPHSDIDLVIIKETSLPFLKRSSQLIEMLDYDVDIDFFVYTPREFAEALRNKKFFQAEIIKKGKVLYEKAA